MPETTLPVFRIEATKGWRSLKLGEVWQARELLYFLTLSNIKVKYKQTLLGASWAIIQPFFTMVVFSLFFGKLAKMPRTALHTPSSRSRRSCPGRSSPNGITQSSESVVRIGNTVKRVYFPRLIIPLSSIMSGLVDFVLAFTVLLGMMLWYGIAPTMNVLWLPAFLFLALATALGAGFFLAALNVEYRDVRYVVPFWCRSGSSRRRSPIRAACSPSPGERCMASTRWPA
jgi:lipopolysaccharide transport system permease protein